MKNSWKFLLWMIVWWWFLYLYFSNFGTLPWIAHSPTWFETAQPLEYDWSEHVFDPQKQLNKYNSLYELLDKTYYDKENLNIEDMQENALKWFVDAIWDPYTVYLTEEENQIFDEWMQWSQEFEGIWAVVTKKEDGILIESVLKWSPAFKAWIVPLDLILQIDWEPTSKMGLNDWVALIRWEKGTDVVLMILREWDEPLIEDVVVTRWSISVPSVEWFLLEEWDKKVLHIVVSVFWDDTMKTFESVVREYNNFALDWVILDLRWNWWWYLPIAVELASSFLPKNEIVTTAKYTIFDDEVFRSKGYGTFQDIPTIVMIDWLSASASEIVASSLVEYGRAITLWTTSFGKWSIQTLHTNEDESSLKFTIGKWYTPNGENIDKKWVEPTIEVEFDTESFKLDWTDNQVDRAVEYFLEKKTDE